MQMQDMQMQELTAGHGTLTAARTGRGRDLVILHPLLADRHVFDSLLPALAEKHRVTLINLPGFHGSQPAPLALMDAYVAVIEGGFDEFEIGKDAVLIGTGFGGSVALAFAIAHPDRIAKLVVSNASAAYPPEGRQGFGMIARNVAEGGIGAVAEIVAKRMLSPAYLEANPQAVEQRKSVLMGVDAGGFAAACKVMQESDLTPLLHHLKVPTFVVCGALDQVTPPALSKEIAEKVAGATYAELPGCGHCPPLEQPQAFLKAIKDFAGL
jgi:pimeloyl-ACP methyl ester carboxylesterase